MRTHSMAARLLRAGAAGAAVVAMATFTGHARAAVGSLTIEFRNLYSTGLQGDADNTTLSYRLPAQAFITGLNWTVDVQAFDPSWLQELTLAFTASNGEGVQFSPATDVATAGSWQGQGRVDLVNNGLGFHLGSDGRLNLELYDAVDDVAGLPDGRWRSATLQIGYTAAVPEPASAALLLAGLLAVVAGRRRPAA